MTAPNPFPARPARISLVDVLRGSALPGLFALQCALSHLWLRFFQYGPLEWLWRSLTFLSLKTPFLKPRRVADDTPVASVPTVGDPA